MAQHPPGPKHGRPKLTQSLQRLRPNKVTGELVISCVCVSVRASCKVGLACRAGGGVTGPARCPSHPPPPPSVPFCNNPSQVPFGAASGSAMASAFLRFDRFKLPQSWIPFLRNQCAQKAGSAAPQEARTTSCIPAFANGSNTRPRRRRHLLRSLAVVARPTNTLPRSAAPPPATAPCTAGRFTAAAPSRALQPRPQRSRTACRRRDSAPQPSSGWRRRGGRAINNSRDQLPLSLNKPPNTASVGAGL